jgi:hypothetical protein
LADFGIDRRAGELAIGKHDARSFCRHDHFLQEFGPDLVAKAARATVDSDDDIVRRKPEDPGNGSIENLRNRLDLEIMIAGAERTHLPALPFLGAVRNMLRPGARHHALLLDPFEVILVAPTALDRPMGAAQ